ncbi:hypothetical protein ARD30_20330 [Bosea thiooxidans]|jgi:hypothetical protein|uniref:AAA+ ATPase domain-containing protein n=1 Tax=Bosea thiooxidans TaxID=53254 RepID=A0A0Q3STP6_9HYPH|nr:AAA family ATPase [Bosea thiooxidans]KQK28810.1 hypothetical protein ARD30_20330 [Bosea thiooxidans]
MSTTRRRKALPGWELPGPPATEATADTTSAETAPAVEEAEKVRIFDVAMVRGQIEQLIGREYHGHLEEYLGSPSPKLSDVDQTRLDRLLALHDDQKHGFRSLLFGAQAHIDALATERLRCPGFEPIVDLIARAAMLSQRTGSPLFVPPLLLAGPPGVGKTHAARRIAQALQTDMQIISCATNSDFQALTVGHPTSWKAASMGRMTEAMVSGASAQPIIVLDEIDKLSTHETEQPYNALLAILEAENSRALLDEFVRVPFDMSQAIIIATANDVSRLPDFIRSRLMSFAIASPQDEALLAIARLIASDIVAELRGGVPMPSEDILRRAARHNPRRLGKLLRLAFGFAAADGRSELRMPDIVAAEGLVVEADARPSIGFLTSSSVREGRGVDGSGTAPPRVGPSRG